jgi:hypothetical protein
MDGPLQPIFPAAKPAWGRKKVSKNFFFEKKKQKTFISLGPWR